MDKNIQEQIQSLQKSSRMIFPLALFALILVVGSLVFSYSRLGALRNQIKTLDSELVVKAKQLREADERIQNAKSNLESINNQLVQFQPKLLAGELRNEPLVSQLISETAALEAAVDAASVEINSDQSRNNAKYGSTNIDLFYCTNDDRNKNVSDSAFEALSKLQTGRLRSRPFSEEVNSLRGFRVKKNVVRFSDDERDMARKLKVDIESATGVTITLQEIDYDTPSYISIFFCGAKSP